MDNDPLHPERPDGAARHLRRLNLNLAYALDAILRAPTLTAAGHAIRLSQPAMSLALRKLREHFGDELVAYQANGRRLTALAEAVAPRVRQLLAQAHDLFTLDLDFDPRVARRTITLAAPEPVEIAFLAWIAPGLLHEGDGLTLDFVSLDRMSSTMLFDAGVDIAIVPETMLDPECRHLPLFSQGLSCLIWEGHPTIGDEMTIEQYQCARHAALSSALERSAALRDLSHPLMDERTVVVRTDRFSSLPTLIIGTDLVVTATSWFAQYLAYLHPLRAVTCPIPGRTTMYAQWEAYRDRDPIVVWLRDRLRRAAQERWG